MLAKFYIITGSLWASNFFLFIFFLLTVERFVLVGVLDVKELVPGIVQVADVVDAMIYAKLNAVPLVHRVLVVSVVLIMFL